MKIRLTTIEEVELDLSKPIYRKTGKVRLYFCKIWEGGSIMVNVVNDASIELGSDSRAYSVCETESTEGEFLDAFNEALERIKNKL